MAHPLDQITAEEINKAADLCKSREGFDENTIFFPPFFFLRLS